MNYKLNTTLADSPRTAKRANGFIVISDDPGDSITPDQVDIICDLYLDIYGSEPGRGGLKKIGNFTRIQAEIKIEVLQLITRLCREDENLHPEMRGWRQFKRHQEKRALKKRGYRLVN